MKIACITYRSWAEKIYRKLEERYPEHEFLIYVSKNEFCSEELEDFDPDLILWYGWSWMIDDRFTASYTSVMLHPSPLPKYRGGSPIQNQIINGDSASAVSLFKITSELDAGDIFVQHPITLKGNIEDIFNTISDVGFQATCKIVDGDYTLTEQDHSAATYCKRRKEDESEITLEEIENASGQYLYNKIRMLTGPYPRAYIMTKDNKKLSIERAFLDEV